MEKNQEGRKSISEKNSILPFVRWTVTILERKVLISARTRNEAKKLAVYEYLRTSNEYPLTFLRKASTCIKEELRQSKREQYLVLAKELENWKQKQ
jgi:hypothetical protein